MYDYRDLTEEEQQEVLKARKERGYPLHAPPHPHKDFDMYHVWNSCTDHEPIFSGPENLSLLMDLLMEGLAEHELSCRAWVFLPNHFHLLVQSKEFNQISEALRLSLSNVSTTINRKQDQKGRTVWNRYAERGIRNGDHYWNVINYIHNNPVEHDYVDHITSWPWSSVHHFLEQFGKAKMKKIWQTYPVDEYMEDWSPNQ